VALGQRLFFDKRMSRDGTVSCATCHSPAKFFADEKSVAVGLARQLGTRNAPSLINAAFQTTQFWDGRRDSLELQAMDPLLNPLEHGLRDETDVIAVLRSDKQFVRVYERAFPAHKDGVSASGIRQALAAFQRTLIAGDSAFDRYYFGNQKAALNQQAERGLALFDGRALCSSCHQINAGNAMFSDNRFHSLSVGLKSLDGKLAALTTHLVKRKNQYAVLDFSILNDKDISELGRFVVTLDPADIGAFRTPSLRNVALTAPYMHDGSIATLDEAVEYELYYRSGELGYPLIMTPGEKADLLAFLKALTSSESALAPLSSMTEQR
jgi:cytochrome c peroxidase